MKCPICSNSLVEESGLLVCVKNHGVLLSGKQLLNRKKIKHDESAGNTDKRSLYTKLVCPHCSSSMVQLDFNSSGVYIDSCSNCSWRWLDVGELTKILQSKPKLTSEQLLFLDDVSTANTSTTDSRHDYLNTSLDSSGVMRSASAAGVKGGSTVLLGSIVSQFIKTGVKGSSVQRIVLFIAFMVLFGVFFLIIASLL